MYYNPETKQTLDRPALKRLLNASIPMDAEEVGGWRRLHNGAAPETQYGQSIVPDAIEFVDGRYVQTFKVVGKPAVELADESEARIAALEDGLAELAQMISEGM